MQTSKKAQKHAIRREIREKRRQKTTNAAKDAARAAANHLTTSSLWSRTQHLALYLANDGELDPAPIARAARSAGKILYLPTITSNGLIFRRWDDGSELVENRFGIGECQGPALDPATLQLLITPLVAWDEDGSRLGMGGGYYDRFIGENAPLRARCLGLAYCFQQHSGLAALGEPWDQRLHGVITETGLRLF